MPDDGGRKPFRAVIVDARGSNERECLAGAQPTLRRWRRGGLSLAVVCSQPGHDALSSPEHFEVVIDDSRNRSPTVDATVRLYGEANRRLDTGPMDALVVARDPASVRAAEALGFRRIVGIDRDGAAPQLLEAGAQSVITDLRGLRFARTLPAALDSLGEITGWFGERSLAIFLDFDGTLSPIVAHPDDAVLAPGMREVIARLAERYPLAVISGRDRLDVAARVGLDALYYAGSHGLDIAGPGGTHTPPGADAARRRLRAAAEDIRRSVADLPGVVIEPKRFSVAVHYRQVAPNLAEQVIAAAQHAGNAWGLEVRRGKQVRELVPALGWHKGRAVQWLCETLQIDPAQACVIYIGDDETDEDAFQALGPNGIGLRPGPRVAASLADYSLGDVDQVRRFLQWLERSM